MGKSVWLVGIAGDSASGKGTLARALLESLDGQAAWVSLDDYHVFDRRERKERKITPLRPEANHLGLMARHYRALASGEAVLKPVYDHSTGTFGRPQLFRPPRMVIFTGLLPFATRELEEALDLKVFLDTHPELKYAWKVARDCRTRGYTPEDLARDMARREPDFTAFVEPQRDRADLVISQLPAEGGVRSRLRAVPGIFAPVRKGFRQGGLALVPWGGGVVLDADPAVEGAWLVKAASLLEVDLPSPPPGVLEGSRAVRAILAGLLRGWLEEAGTREEAV